MLRLFRRRSLSNVNLWSNFNLRYLCCVIVAILSTFQLVYSDNNSTASQCQCNSTTTGPSSLNATETICNNCTQDTKNCKKGYQFLNGTCVRCFCNSTAKPINCNCTDVQTPQSKICSPGQFLSNSSQPCINCSCNVHTSLNNNCDNRTGQCFCQEYVTGQHCTTCASNYTANYSSSGELLKCFKQCPTGFKRAERNECIKANSTSSLPLVMSSTGGVITSTDSVVPTSISSTPVLTSLLTEVPSSPQTPSTYLVASSNSPIPTPSPSPSITIKPIQTPSPTIESPSSSSPQPPSSSPASSSPSSSSPPPSSSPPSPPPTTGKPISTNTPPTSANTPTTDHVPTTGQESSPKSATDKPATDKPSKKPTTKDHHTKKPSKDNSSDTVVIVVTCVGVVAILAIAIAVGCYCLRSKRKPSTPFWTVELSNTRNNEELDFALLDPVTDEPHKKADEADASITEHSRYYAYI